MPAGHLYDFFGEMSRSYPIYQLGCLVFITELYELWASLVAQRLKHLPAMRGSWGQSLGWEDLPEKEMATHSSILAWKVPWTKEPGGLYSTG